MLVAHYTHMCPTKPDRLFSGAGSCDAYRKRAAKEPYNYALDPCRRCKHGPSELPTANPRLRPGRSRARRAWASASRTGGCTP